MLILLAADLGGHLVYRLRSGVNQGTTAPGPEEFTSVLAANLLPPGAVQAIDLDYESILLARSSDGDLYALGNRCTHLACALDGGTLGTRSVTCPGHGSEFDLSNGHVRRGPATAPEPSYEIRENAGQLEIRRRSDGAES